jgi:hypothetical protein
MCFAGGLGPVRGRGGALCAGDSVQLFRRHLGTRVSKAIAIEGNLERLIASMGENHQSPLINSYDGLRPPPDDVGRQRSVRFGLLVIRPELGRFGLSRCSWSVR